MHKGITAPTHKLRAVLWGHPVLQIGLSLFALLIAIYCLTYSGTFVTDDEHILSSRALSLAFDKSVNDNRVYGNSRVFALSNLAGTSATQALNIEPGQEIIGSTLARLAVILHIGHIQTLFLLNIGVTALTSAVLFATILFLGHSIPVAMTLSLLFGLGTLAWPYARTYFRDPLAMLFLILAWLCAKVIKNNNFSHYTKRTHYLVWLGVGLFLGAGILSKNTVAFAVPVVVADLVINIKKDKPGNHFSIKSILGQNWKKLVLSIGILFILLRVWIQILPHLNLLARFTPSYYGSLILFFFTTPHPQFFQALTGPFVSPGKSIFLYSPILLLSIFGLVSNPKTAWPAWLYLLLLVTGQALFYDKDWGGSINWGLRFTLPAIPLLLIASAPVAESWLRSVIGRIGLSLLGAISVVVQAIGILPPISDYYTQIFTASPPISEFATFWTPKYSALLWNIQWILSGGRIDLALARMGEPAILIVVGLMILIAMALLSFKKIKWLWLPWAVFFLSAGFSFLMVAAYGKDPAYFGTRTDLEVAQEKISREYLTGDLILLKSYGSSAWYFMMNWGNSHLPWTSLPFYYPAPSLIIKAKAAHDPEMALDEITLSLFRKIPGAYQRVWLIVPADSPGADLNLEVDWLENKSISTASWVFPGNQGQTWLYLFEIQPGALP